MAITRIGSVTHWSGITGRDNNTGSDTLSVPSDAQFAIVGVSGTNTSTNNYFSGGAATLGGAAMTAVPGGDAAGSSLGCAFFYLLDPPTGAQTFAWNWSGASGSTFGTAFSYAFYKGLHTSTPVRDSYGMQDASAPYNMTTDAMTASAGDLIVTLVSTYKATDGDVATYAWTNATSVLDVGDETRKAVFSWAETAATGDTTVSVVVTNAPSGGLVSVVMRPPDAASTWVPRIIMLT